MTYQSAILKYLGGLGTRNAHVNPDEKHNTGSLLGQWYLWNVAKRFCESRLKDIEAEVVKEGIIPDKDQVRKQAEKAGTFPYETELAHSPHFSVVAKVSSPSARFDKDEFMWRAAKKFKVPKHKLMELAEDCKVKSAPAVSVSVVEKE